MGALVYAYARMGALVHASAGHCATRTGVSAYQIERYHLAADRVVELAVLVPRPPSSVPDIAYQARSIRSQHVKLGQYQ
eukprot:2550813-Rhodomonas_salina.9